MTISVLTILEEVLDISMRISALILGICLMYYSLSRYLALLNSYSKKKEDKEKDIK